MIQARRKVRPVRPGMASGHGVGNLVLTTNDAEPPTSRPPVCVQASLEHAELRISQPIAQSQAIALASEDMGLLGSKSTEYGVEPMLAPFVQQAEAYAPPMPPIQA